MRSRQLAFVAALAFAIVIGAVVTQAQTSVAGDWVLTVNGPQGTIDTEASFKQAGEKVKDAFKR